MNVRDQLAILVAHRVEFVVVGDQAGVLRQAIEFSHDLDVIVRATPGNAERVRAAVSEIANVEPELDLVLGRDFQQYVDEATGTEIDVHLKLVAIDSFEAASDNASEVDFLGIRVSVLELPALYASKRTDRPRDALHRRAIEDRLRHLVLAGRVEADEVVLACCLDGDVARLEHVASRLSQLAGETEQPLLQARLAALGLELARLSANPRRHSAVRALLSLDPVTRARIVARPARLAALLAQLPLLLSAEGHHVRPAPPG